MEVSSIMRTRMEKGSGWIFLIRTICRADVDVKFILSAGHGVVHDVCCVVVPCECTHRNSNFPNHIQIQAKKKRAEALSFLSADLNQKYQGAVATSVTTANAPG